MAHTHAAKKSYRQALKNRERNISVRRTVRGTLHDARRAITQKKTDEAAALVTAALKAFDKAVAKGVVKKNTAARKKSRLQSAYNALKGK